MDISILNIRSLVILLHNLKCGVVIKVEREFSACFFLSSFQTSQKYLLQNHAICSELLWQDTVTGLDELTFTQQGEYYDGAGTEYTYTDSDMSGVDFNLGVKVGLYWDNQLIECFEKQTLVERASEMGLFQFSHIPVTSNPQRVFQI